MVSGWRSHGATRRRTHRRSGSCPRSAATCVAIIPGASSPAWSADGAKLVVPPPRRRRRAAELTVSNVDGTDAQVILAGRQRLSVPCAVPRGPPTVRPCDRARHGRCRRRDLAVPVRRRHAAASDHRTCVDLLGLAHVSRPTDAESSTRRTAAARRTSGCCRLAAASPCGSPRGRALTNRRASRRMERSRSSTRGGATRSTSPTSRAPRCRRS